MGWEYLHWIDLTLTNLMEVVIFKIHLTKIQIYKNLRVFNQQNVQKRPKRSNGLKTDSFANQGMENLKIGKSEGPYISLGA